MTRKLSGLWSLLTANKAPLASLAVMGTLACSVALTGCGSSSGGGGAKTTPDGGGDAEVPETSTTLPDVGTPDVGPTLAACATPTFDPVAGTIAAGTNVVIAAAGLPAAPVGYIFFTTDNTLPSRTSPTYNAGTIGVQGNASETFRAISSTLGTTCADSPIATAAYTVTAAATDGGGAPAIPTFSPTGTATTQSNDFQVSLTSTAGSTLCYTFGATAPICTTTAASATCANGSSTYTAPITVSSAVTATSTTPGQVEIQAIACAPGATTSAAAKQLYTLQAAAPTMTPAPGTETWSSTLTGTLVSTTALATIYYTTNGTAPSCGTPVAGQQTYAGIFPLATASYEAVACKTGYLASATAGPFAFTVNLTPPTISPAAGTFPASPTFTVSNAANPTSSWVCYSASTTAPACGAAGVCSAGTLLAAAGTFTGVVDGGNVQAIACAAAGLSNSTVASQGPYKLQLAAPVILPDATTAPAASYAIPAADGANLLTLNLSQASVATPADQAGSYICWLKDPGVGIAPACGANSTCVNTASAPLAGAGPTNIEGLGPFGAGDSVAAITCPGAAAASGLGFEASAVSTTVFIGVGQATPPAISLGTGTYTTKVNSVLTNTNPASATICYSTSEAPTCTAGSTAAGCATVDGTNSQSMAFTIPAGSAGAGYINPPVVTLTGGGGTCATLQAAITGGALSSITATGCSGFTNAPTVVLTTGAGAASTATFGETVSITVTNGGAGYATAPTVSLVPADGVGSCAGAITATLVGPALSTITASGCNFDEVPSVVINNTGTGGSGAQASATISQTITVTAGGGSNYTAAPIVTLTPAGTTSGSCSSVLATLTGTSVSAVTATGCTGFSQNPTVVFASQTPTTAASALAVPGNSVLVPAIENNPTTLQAVVCGTGITASPIVSATYGTALTNATLQATDTLTAAVLGGSGTTISAGDTLTIATTSNFTDTKLVYSVDGITIPNCTGTGTAFAGSSTTIPVPDPSKSPLVLNVIACGANQTASTLQTGTFPIVVANPVITDAVGAIALASTDHVGVVGISAQNDIAASIASPTPTSYVCYTTDGSAPSCSGTATVACNTTLNANQTLATTFPAAVSVTTSGTALRAVACEGTLAASGTTGPVDYTLDITAPSIVGTPTAACPSVVAFGFDNTTSVTGVANVAAGGVTTGVTLCYSLVGPPSACTAGMQAGAGLVTCFTPTTAAPTANVDATQNGNIFTYACKSGFANSPQSSTLGVTTVTPFTEPAITVDGVLNAAEWSATIGDLFPSNTGTLQGGFTFGNTGGTIYLSETGFTAAAGTDVVFYLANANSTLDTTTAGVPALGTGVLPFAARYAVAISTATPCSGTSCAASITAYAFNGAAWAVSAALKADVTAAVTATSLEASIIPTTFISSSSSVNVTGVIYNGTALSSGWSPTAGGAWDFVSDSVASCQSPAQTLE